MHFEHPHAADHEPPPSPNDPRGLMGHHKHALRRNAESEALGSAHTAHRAQTSDVWTNLIVLSLLQMDSHGVSRLVEHSEA
jgi:hypothetical protein